MINPIKNFYALAFCIFLLSTPTAIAAGNIYSGIDVGSTHFSGDGPPNNGLGGTLIFQKGQRFNGSDVSYGVHLGYRITDWMAVELGYQDFGSATQQFKVSPNVMFLIAPQDTQTLAAKGTSFSVIASHDISSRFALFGLVGIANMEYENKFSGGVSGMAGSLFSTNSYSNQGMIYGVGARYEMNKSFALRTDLRRNNVGDFILDCASVGVEYSF